MGRSLRRAGWALATAGSIGLATSAGAQGPPLRFIEPGGHVVQTADTVVMTEAQARLEEGQLELAFLADPMLFSYSLGAHVQGTDVEVRGFVPTEAVREQALTVARQQSALPVVDKIKLHPTLAGHGSVDRPDNIIQAARTLLEGAFPDDGPAFRLKCDARGKVTVGGSIASFEDKVLVSRKLRQVPGCGCVINELVIARGHRDTRMAPSSQGPDKVNVTPGMARPVSRVTESAVPPFRPVAMPVKKDGDGSSLLRTPSPTPLPTWSGLSSEPAPIRSSSPPSQEIPMLPAPAPSRMMPEKKEPPRQTSPVPTLDIPPLDPVRPAPAVRLPEPTRRTLPPALPPVSVPQSRAPAVEKHPAGGSEESYVTEGVITFGDDPPAAKPAAPRVPRSVPTVATMNLAPPPLPPSRPVSARLDLSAPPAVRPQPPTLAAPVRPTPTPAMRLKERIQGICGPAYEVKVTTTVKDRLHLVITARDERDGQRLMDRIVPVLREFATVAIDVDIDTMTPSR